MFQKAIFIVFISLLALGSGKAQVRSIYNVFLSETLPANGSETYFNAPILRWPYQKGKQVHYEIQLSQDNTFNSPGTITKKSLTGAFFNPHQKLSMGVWFWHFRVEGKDWSPTLNFIISDKALSMVSASAETFLAAVSAVHPRILLDHKSPGIKKQMNDPDASAIIHEADSYLEQKILTEKDATPAAIGENEKQNKKINQDAIVGLGNTVNKYVLAICQAYILTNNPKYIKKGIDIGMEIANWDPKGISGTSDFMDGICMYNMSLVFDTFYDQLTEDQRAKLVSAISERASEFYKSWVNNIESKVLSGHVWQLLLNEFFKTCIALKGHEKESEKWLSYAYELFLARAPVLGGLDGGWAEGSYYFTMNMETLIEIPEKIKTYTGFDFIRAHPWYTNQADWMIYHFPAGSSSDGYGDNAEELFEPPSSYAAFSVEMARLTQIPKYKWYADRIIQQQHVNLSKETTLRWNRLLHASLDKLPVVPSSMELPMGHLSKEVGVAALHTQINRPKEDIMITMRSSPFGAYGHILADQNCFNVFVGGKRLFFRTGYKVSMDDPHRIGWSKHTKSENGILINGEGQPYSVEAYGNISRFMQGEQLAYMKGEASNAYQSKETKEDYGVTKFLRHIVLLQPGIIVVYDELEAKQPSTWSWLIHSIENMKIDTGKQTFTSEISHAKGIGKFWSSSSVQWNLKDKFDVPAVLFRNYDNMRTKKYEDNQWHLKINNLVLTSGIRFLTVIQICKDGKILQWKESQPKNGIQRIQIGSWEIEAAVSTDIQPKLTIKSLTGITAFSAYDAEMPLQNIMYKTTKPGNSILLEMINGKPKFTEVSEMSVNPIR